MAERTLPDRSVLGRIMRILDAFGVEDQAIGLSELAPDRAREAHDASDGAGSGGGAPALLAAGVASILARRPTSTPAR